ncbi:tetracycline resistance ribosomal protection protein Otr(A) [Streptomyces sp. NPDC059590]|uniref:tetracycline resistance ribosomal protection protein Otr(A) n=1 Tax=Streptomyces sp. NPDC059590 TaxID=3346877 RepID=UPI0036A87A32
MPTSRTPRAPRIARTLNIGILAHVDAGKTSLTERLLFDHGAIDRLGSVDSGTTQTDTGDIERERGITVRSAVASFTVGSAQVNLIDTPGHSDFIAEVERALGVLDGAVLVLSAVEGVQAQTRVLMKTLRRLRLPTLLFVNKIDRAGARQDGLLTDIRDRLAPHIVAMTAVRGPGTRNAHAVPRSLDDADVRTQMAEALAETDDALLARVLDGPPPTPAELRAALAAGTADCRVHPVFFGSALSGQGVGALARGMARLLPPAPVGAEAAAAPYGTVFAVERRAGAGQKTACLRLFAGELTVRQKVTLHRRGPGGTPVAYTGQLTSLDVVGRPGAGRLTAGNIGRVRGLPEVRVGDRLGPADAAPDGPDDPGGPARPEADQPHFAAPSLSTVVRAREPGPGPAARLHAALVSLAEQDPLIHTRALPGGTTSVLLYGEVQKEIIAATLARDFGIEADFEPSRPVHVERPVGVGEACEEMARRRHTGLWATIGLRVEPAPAGSGVAFRYETELGALPRAFHHAIEETVHDTLLQGHGGRAVTDCRVTLIRSGFSSPLSTARDFRELTPVVLERALRGAGTRVYEPCHAFELEIPHDTLAPVTARLTAAEAEIAGVAETAGGAPVWLLEGRIPAREVHGVKRWLPGLTRGEGVWWSRPSGDRPLGPGRETGPGWETPSAAPRAPQAGRTDSAPSGHPFP